MIKNRAAALLVIFLIYVLAAAFGFFAFDYFSSSGGFGMPAGVGLNLSWQLSFFLADVAATVLVFIFSLIFRNASVYDPYWSVQPPVILIFTIYKIKQVLTLLASSFAKTFGTKEVAGFGLEPFGILLLSAVLFWALRLTANWIYNFKSFEYQDWRYVMLKEKSGKLYPLVNFFGIHMFPTCVVYLCVLPAVTLFVEGADFKPWCAVFIALSFAAAILQGIADIQMHKFRASGTGGFIRTGLWKHSRHPNYACEILMWWGVGLASVSALGWQRWYLLSGALVNTLMFLFVSIPMADKRQSRKPGFEEYKKATRML